MRLTLRCLVLTLLVVPAAAAVADELTGQQSVLCTAVQATVCDLLDTRGSDDAVGTALERLLEMASRGPFDPAELLPYVVEAAGAGCNQRLPTAVQAMERYLGA